MYKCVYIYVYIYVYVCMYVCVRVCVYILSYYYIDIIKFMYDLNIITNIIFTNINNKLLCRLYKIAGALQGVRRSLKKKKKPVGTS